MISNTQTSIVKSRLFRIVMIIRLLCGYYFYSKSSLLFDILKRCYCVAVVVALYFIIPDEIQALPFKEDLIPKIQYFAGFFMSMFFEKSMINYFDSVFKTDDILAFDSVVISEPAFAGLVIHSAIASGVVFYNLNSNTFVAYLPTLLFFQDLPYTFVFSMLYERMKQIRLCLECKYIDLNVIKSERVKYKIINLKKCFEVYDRLLDHLDSANALQVWILIRLSLTYPQVVLMACFVIQNFYDQSLKWFIVTILCLSNMVLLSFAPAMFSEATIQENKRIMKTLMKQIIQCEDSALRVHLQRALDYITLRPYKFCVCSAFPLKLSMPLTVLGLLTNHITVYMQFEKLFKHRHNGTI